MRALLEAKVICVILFIFMFNALYNNLTNPVESH